MNGFATTCFLRARRSKFSSSTPNGSIFLFVKALEIRITNQYEYTNKNSRDNARDFLNGEFEEVFVCAADGFVDVTFQIGNLCVDFIGKL